MRVEIRIETVGKVPRAAQPLREVLTDLAVVVGLDEFAQLLAQDRRRCHRS